MTTDRLRVEGNERIDLGDFNFIQDISEADQRQLFTQFMTHPTKTQKWVLDGFGMTAMGTVLTVTRGRAILAYRVGDTIRYGVLASSGDASQTIDLAAYPSGTYGIYIRFELTPAEAESRVFWNPENNGFEYAKTINTRYEPEWSARVELASPGDEWLKIGEIVQSTRVITDQRNFFFEGQASAAYASGWSTDGGGVANDRSATRASYGVTDLQTFTASMRQCLEDIKGRGLRRWWSREIGGLTVGYDENPEEDQIKLGDTYFRLNYNSGNPRLQFDTTDYWEYTRGPNVLTWKVGSVNTAWISPGGILNLGDANFSLNYNSGNPIIYLDSDTYISFNRTSNILTFGQAAIPQMWLQPVGDLRLGDDAFKIAYNGASPMLQFDTGDTLVYDRVNNTLTFNIAYSPIATWTATKLAIGSTVGFNMDYNAGNPKLSIGAYGDTGFYLSYGYGTNPAIFFAPEDSLSYDTALNVWSFKISGMTQMTLRANGDLRIYDDNFKIFWNSNSPAIMFDDGDYLSYSRSANIFTWYIGYTMAAQILTGVLGAKLAVGDTNFSLEFGAGSPRINFASNACWYYPRSNSTLYFMTNGQYYLGFSPGYVQPMLAGMTLGSATYRWYNVYTRAITMSHTAPIIKMEDTDATANYKKTWFRTLYNYFEICAVNDAETNVMPFLRFERNSSGVPTYIGCYGNLEMSPSKNILLTANNTSNLGSSTYAFNTLYCYAVRNNQGGLTFSVAGGSTISMTASIIYIYGQTQSSGAICTNFSISGWAGVSGYLGITASVDNATPGVGDVLSGGKANHGFLKWKLGSATIWIPFWDDL
jgi:hypothetical protein